MTFNWLFPTPRHAMKRRLPNATSESDDCEVSPRVTLLVQVMPFDDFQSAGGWDAAKQAGKMRLEGKEYVVKDGEIVHIRNSKG